MKKLNYLLSLCLLFPFIACNEDDDNVNNSEEIIAYTSPVNSVEYSNVRLESVFNIDFHYIETDIADFHKASNIEKLKITRNIEGEDLKTETEYKITKEANIVKFNYTLFNVNYEVKLDLNNDGYVSMGTVYANTEKRYTTEFKYTDKKLTSILDSDGDVAYTFDYSGNNISKINDVYGTGEVEYRSSTIKNTNIIDPAFTFLFSITDTDMAPIALASLTSLLPRSEFIPSALVSKMEVDYDENDDPIYADISFDFDSSLDDKNRLLKCSIDMSMEGDKMNMASFDFKY